MLRTKASGLRQLAIVAMTFSTGVIFAGGAFAASISDGNSTLTINPSSASSPFITSWVVDGVDQYAGLPDGFEDFTYTTGSGSPNELNMLTVTSSSFSDGIASILYTGNGFTVGVKEILSGGNAGSGASGINETITVTNTGTPVVPSSVTPDFVASPVLTFNLTDTVNLNVNGTPNNDTLTLSPATGTNTADQTDPSGAKVNFTTTPTPDVFTTIDPNTGTPGTTLGPVTGDEAFAATWNMSLNAGDSEIVSINDVLSGAGPAAVPLPNSASATLAMLAGLGLFGIVRRMRKTAI